MKVIELIDELEELITRGNTIPFSARAMVNPEEAMEIIDEIRVALPPELAEARKVVAEKKQILYEAQQEADKLTKDVQNKLRQVISKDEITKEAQHRANMILDDANKQSMEIRKKTQKYSDKILYNLQLRLKEVNDKIENDRKELKQITE